MIKRNIINAIVSCAATWILISFLTAEMSPAKWELWGRSWALILLVIFGILNHLILHNIDFEKRDRKRIKKEKRANRKWNEREYNSAITGIRRDMDYVRKTLTEIRIEQMKETLDPSNDK